MTPLERMKLRIPENDNEVELVDVLDSAKAIILSRRYPFGEQPDVLEKRYEDLQVRIAVELYNKRGVEGQTSHSENGVSRSYSSASVSEELLREITPKAGVV
jgi:hypothetical protein